MNREENLPLVGFTALSPIAIGGLAGLLLVRGTPNVDVDWTALAVLGVGLLALIASALHLGHPLRAYRAVAQLSTSWLSREVALFGVFVLLLAAYTLPIHARVWDGIRGPLAVLACVVGGLSLWATGEVYRLPSRPAWNSWRTIASPLLGALGAGLLLGLFLGRLGVSPRIGVSLRSLCAAALLLGMANTGLCLRRPDLARVEELAAWQVVVGPCRLLIVFRLAGALCALGLLWAGTTASIFAWVPAAIAEIADRALFFRAVVPVSVARRAGVLPFEPVAVVKPLRALPPANPRGVA